MSDFAPPFARATGIGSWPGTAARPAAEVVVGELADALAHLVELPARGVGADMLGRAGALLLDLAVDTVPRGYRIVARPGAVTRRAVSLLNEDMDALEEACETAGLRGSGQVVKVQAPGPITLSAGLELANGHRAITDPGAVRDLAASLAEGVAAHRATLARRLDTPVVVQFDEPSLPAALGGRLTGVTALTPVAPLDEAVAGALLDTCAEAAGADVMVHSCAPELPWELLRRSAIGAVSVDAGTLCAADLDGVAAFVETGRTVVLGVVPAVAPLRRPAAEEVAGQVVAVTDRLGFSRSALRDRVGVSPACGLAGATPQWARTAIGLARKAAEAFAQDPDAI
ncbi:methionine synthase [Mycobacterium kansasii]|uniref:methionine synthase n=1 Tax=Mycobacterium kansasii TaxID=1768 RepID=UPI000CDD50EB|nr:methionine synthase [Mycobacterium kansasii]POX85211.1 methionine synthase [Mycobacterium kansasii]POY09737.1 methionine synthase [Mycobacterium kansasii]POY24163.1 methionine synthase [Mycobacterium kansasii]